MLNKILSESESELKPICFQDIYNLHNDFGGVVHVNSAQMLRHVVACFVGITMTS